MPWDDDPIAPLAGAHADISFTRAATKDDAIRELKDAEIFLVGGSLYAGEIEEAVNTGAPKLRWRRSP